MNPNLAFKDECKRSLLKLSTHVSNPWLVVRDFNETVSINERKGKALLMDN